MSSVICRSPAHGRRAERNWQERRSFDADQDQARLGAAGLRGNSRIGVHEPAHAAQGACLGPAARGGRGGALRGRGRRGARGRGAGGPLGPPLPGGAEPGLHPRPAAHAGGLRHHLQQLLRVRLLQGDLAEGAGAQDPALDGRVRRAGGGADDRRHRRPAGADAAWRNASTATAASRRGRSPCPTAASP